MSDNEFNLEAQVEVLQDTLRSLKRDLKELEQQLFDYKCKEHLNCGCTDFCFEKKNAEEMKQLHDDAVEQIQLLKEENYRLTMKVWDLEHGIQKQ